MSDWEQRDWLVFERAGEPQKAYTTLATDYGHPLHVRAADELEAAHVASEMRGRVDKYVVVPATVVDLAANDTDLLNQPRPHRA